MKTTKIISLLLALLLVCGIFAGCAGQNTSSPASGANSSAVDSTTGSTVDSAAVKNITVTVVHKDGSSKDFPIAASGETLREALEQEKLIEGEERQYGLFITAADGETANSDNQEWWCVTKGGEQVNTGIDGVKIADGDTYELTLTVGY
ncbi:DUF4430 domain-containing protein [uncultured Neglectibacter sp.]|uniref:DUF4430 domain-containing protein n=1 Tax=uncultured Neglectibacter sp. TaxID=1924108 RepID=UPI0034DF7551